MVQGVGFRPFVHRLAVGLGLDGWVRNDGSGVTIALRGPEAVVAAFLTALRREAPPLARIDAVEVNSSPPVPEPSGPGFTIAPSEPAGGAASVADLAALIPPDVAPCTACREELRDPANRRHRHPFITCTDCGPRWTLALAVPFDRARTTMAPFPLCPACAAEYTDPTSRRHHAETICCPGCGPRLAFFAEGTASVSGDEAALAAAAEVLRAGAIVAVKAVGGYLLAVDATSAPAVDRLRARKHRDEKPFAVQVADTDAARAVAELDALAEALLAGPEAPIVLAPRRPDTSLVTEGVAPGSALIGVMLPSAPLQLLLAEAVGRPLVMTSGNRSDEPIAHDDEDARRRLAGIADAFLVHDRAIARRADDSVLRVARGRSTVMRRARGQVPRAVRYGSGGGTGTTILGVGAELKSTVCVGRGGVAVPSSHLGDLEQLPAFLAFRAAIDDLTGFLGGRPEVVAHDLHPEYLSTKWAREQEGIDLVGVQHHHAHIAACLAEHGHTGPVVGLAFDGHGYGPDGTLWGGEVLLADRAGFRRVGHLLPCRMPGGVAAIREPWRMAAAWLTRLDADAAGNHPVARRQAERWSVVSALADSTRSPVTTSMGRLFDACAALIGLRDVTAFEGQAAMMLEQAAGPGVGRRPGALAALACAERADGVLLLDPLPMLASLADRSAVADADRGQLCGAVHAAIAVGVVDAATRACASAGTDTVVLSGGVFQNALLTELVAGPLGERGLTVLTHRLVPPNDGGISLGQVTVAAALGDRS